MFSIALALLVFSPFTVVFSHRGSHGGSYGGYGDNDNYYGHNDQYSGHGEYNEPDQHEEPSSGSDNENSKTFTCPSSRNTRHYSSYGRPSRPEPSESECSFNETFPDATSLQVTCQCPKCGDFEISTDGSTFDNSLKCNGADSITTQIDSNVFQARQTEPESNNYDGHRPSYSSHDGYYGRYKHYSGSNGGYYGRPSKPYGSNGGYYGRPSKPYGSHEENYGKPSKSPVECTVSPVTETTTAAPTAAPTTPAVPTVTPLPTLPDTTVPALPETTVPALPETTVPALPDTTVPALPDTTVPTLPDTTVPVPTINP